jgi:hypothetical protein
MRLTLGLASPMPVWFRSELADQFHYEVTRLHRPQGDGLQPAL